MTSFGESAPKLQVRLSYESWLLLDSTYQVIEYSHLQNNPRDIASAAYEWAKSKDTKEVAYRELIEALGRDGVDLTSLRIYWILVRTISTGGSKRVSEKRTPLVNLVSFSCSFRTKLVKIIGFKFGMPYPEIKTGFPTDKFWHIVWVDATDVKTCVCGQIIGLPPFLVGILILSRLHTNLFTF